MDAVAGEIPPRILIEEPPRHGKSEMVSKWLPAWYLGTFPGQRVALAAYQDDFAATWGRRVREILEEHGPHIFGITTADDSRARNRWDLRQTWSPDDPELFDWLTSAEGGMFTTGVGGPLTGKGADLLIVDDPVKNQKDADSKTLRDDIWEWWQSTAYTRLEPGAIAIVMHTRWHEDDLAGRLIREAKQGGEEWHVVRLPALAEKGDPLGRNPGDPLWPERYSKPDLERIKIAVGTKVWGALYQQRPSAAEGGEFKDDWWQTYLPYRWPKLATATQSWDCAFKGKADSDFVVGQLWLQKGADSYLAAQIRGRMTFTETLKAIQVMTAWANEKGIKSHRKLIEDKANGTAVMNTLQSKVEGLIPVEPEGGKLARARAVTPRVESGNVHIPQGVIPAPPAPKRADGTPLWKATRTTDFIAEHREFPNGANDDQVDSLTQYLIRASGGMDLSRFFDGPKAADPNADLLEINW